VSRNPLSVSCASLQIPRRRHGVCSCGGHSVPGLQTSRFAYATCIPRGWHCRLLRYSRWGVVCFPPSSHHISYTYGASTCLSALSVGFEYLQTSLGGISAVEEYTFQLTCHLVRCMVSLVHCCLDGQSVGVSLCTIYGRHLEAMVSSKMQGPVIAFSLRWADGSPIGFAEVGRLASERSIYLRTGIEEWCIALVDRLL